MKKRPVTFLILTLLLLLISTPTGSFADSRLPPPDFPLLEAIKKDDVPTVRAVLGASQGHHEVNRSGATGDKPLTIAARRGNLAIVKLLIAHGAMVDIGKETDDRTPLIAAAGQGHAEIVQYLIAQGADVNAKGKGLTPLLIAFAERYSPLHPQGDAGKTIRILLENGADVNVQDESWLKTGRTPLMYAVMQGDAALVQALLSKGARLELKNTNGETALSLARKEGLEYIAKLLEKAETGPAESVPTPDPSLFDAVKEGRLDKVKALIAKGADVNVRNANGSAPLMYAADGNALKMVHYFLKSGADVNAKNGTNNTALIFASTKGHVDVVNLLLRKKADVNVKNHSKGDALIYAVLNKKTKVVSALLKSGARVNEKYDDGKTALLMAVSDGSSDIAKLLIDHQADVNAVDNTEMTALMIACEKGNADVALALLRAGADADRKSKYGDTALSKAISGKHAPIVRMLTKSGGNFNRQEALFSAVAAGNQEIVKLLWTKDVDVNMQGYASGTLLMSAADGDLAMVKFLMEKGADVNKQNDEGQTALMRAVASFKETNISCVRFLLERGADVNAVNHKGESALILAVKRGHAEMAGVLIAKGSALSLKDKAGKSAWSYAVEGDKPALVTLLEKAGAAKNYSGMEWQGNVSQQKEKFVKVVESAEEWSGLWTRALEKPAPDIDFENYVVACVFLGHSADWLYSIGFGQPLLRDNQWVIPYVLHEVMLRLSGPFKAGGQYHMKVLEKKKNVKMMLEEDASYPRRR